MISSLEYTSLAVGAGEGTFTEETGAAEGATEGVGITCVKADVGTGVAEVAWEAGAVHPAKMIAIPTTRTRSIVAYFMGTITDEGLYEVYPFKI